MKVEEKTVPKASEAKKLGSVAKPVAKVSSPHKCSPPKKSPLRRASPTRSRTPARSSSPIAKINTQQILEIPRKTGGIHKKIQKIKDSETESENSARR